MLMVLRRFAASRLALVACLAATATVSCAGSPTYNWPAESALGYKLGPGDVLKINVWKHDELSQQVTVRPDNAISLPLLGDVPATGRNVNEITSDISTRLKQFFQENPPVTVQVSEVHSYRIYVIGEVQKGGEFTPAGEVSVLHGLALAGGFTRFANPDHIVIVRRDARGERRIPFDFSAVVEKGDLQQNLALQTGDTVIVP
jgi:polysaccharide export outer membrane protein